MPFWVHIWLSVAIALNAETPEAQSGCIRDSQTLRPSLSMQVAEVDAQSGAEVSVLSLGPTNSPPASSAGSWTPALVTTARSRQQQGLEPQVGAAAETDEVDAA